MAKRMTRTRQKQWLETIKNFLVDPVELPEGFLYNPGELRDLQRELSHRTVSVGSNMEKLASELEVKNYKEWAQIARNVQQHLEEGLAAMTFVSIVVMRQKHELSAQDSKVKKMEGELGALQKKLQAAEKQLAKCNRCGHQKKGKT